MSDTLYEYYNENDDAHTGFYGAYWRAQTFKIGTVGANQAHDITSIKVKLYRSADPPTDGLDVTINETASNKPTDVILASTNISGDDITTDSAGEWIEIAITGATLQPDTTYAIVLSAPSGNSSKWVRWFYDGSSPEYTGGRFCASSNSGSSWIGDSAKDFMFEEYGTTGGAALEQKLSDSIALAETIKFDIGVKPSDSLAMAETLASQSTFNVALDDTITFAEALAAAQTFNLTLADTQTLAESLVAARGLVADLQDTLDLSETLKHDIGVALADTTALAETIAHAIEYNVSLTDTLALSESIAHAIGIYLTETLDLDEDLSVELTAAIRKILKGAMARKMGQPTPINIGIGM